MKDFAELIRAIAALLWPIIGFTVVLLFKGEIAGILQRVKKGKLLGQELELSDSLDQLQRSADAASSEFPVQSLNRSSVTSSTQIESEMKQTDVVRRVLEEAVVFPKAALMMLSLELERELRRFMTSMAPLTKDRYYSLPAALKALEQHGSLPEAAKDALHHFWDVRNQMVHGYGGKPDNVLRAIDSGVTILKILQNLPYEVNVVYQSGIELYGDKECQQLLEGVCGVILESKAPGGPIKSMRIWPTARTNLQKGQQVVPEWDSNHHWEAAWYRDPDTGETQLGWTGALEFVGYHLEDRPTSK